MLIEFTSTFPENSIRSMTATGLVNWIDFLRSCGIHIEREKGIRRVTALCKCLITELFEPIKNNENKN